MTTSDVLVIGGGVIGLAAALACAEAGARVTVLRGTAPPASLAAGGMLCPSFEAMHEGGAALAALGAESLALWDGFAARLTGGDPAQLDYRREGAVGVGYPPGFLRGEIIDASGLVEATGAVLVAGEGQVDPRALLVQMDQRLGALNVSCLAVDADALLEADGRVLGARAGGHAVRAGRTILAAGVGAATRFGLPPGLIVPVRGRAFAVRQGSLPKLPASGVLRAPSVYLCQKADGTIYVGATEEMRPADAMLDGLRLEAGWLMPSLREAERLFVYDGVRPGTRDGLPLIRPSERANLFLALGHHRNGVLLAPLTAQRAAAWASA